MILFKSIFYSIFFALMLAAALLLVTHEYRFAQDDYPIVLEQELLALPRTGYRAGEQVEFDVRYCVRRSVRTNIIRILVNDDTGEGFLLGPIDTFIRRDPKNPCRKETATTTIPVTVPPGKYHLEFTGYADGLYRPVVERTYYTQSFDVLPSGTGSVAPQSKAASIWAWLGN